MDLFSYRGRYLWKLRTSDLYDNVDIEISWLEFLPKNYGSKYQRERMINSSQKFLLLVLERPYRKWGTGMSAPSFRNWYVWLRILTRWMFEKNIWKYSNLKIENIIDFLKSRKSRHGNGLPAAQSIEVYIGMFTDLWMYRYDYPDSLKIDIVEYEDEVRAQIRARDAKPWRAVDEDYALQLINDAICWIRTYGDFFLDTARIIYTSESKWVGVTRSDRDARSTKLYSSICEQPVFREIAGKLDCSCDGKGLTEAFTATIGAAINILLFMIGNRVSELVRLDVGCAIGEKDENEIPYLYGIAAKKSGAKRKWVAGSPVVEIVKWIEDLYSQAREGSSVNALFLARTSGSVIPLPRRKLHRMSAATPVTAMRRFAEARFRAQHSSEIHLHPHAARKTFAAFVVRRDKNALEALSLHFGHAYRAFTDGAYAGNLDLQKLLQQADRDELGRSLTDLMVSPQLAGRAATTVEKHRGSNDRFRGKVVLEQKVHELIERGVKIAPCNWGYCLYSQSTSACGGDARGPNELQRSPDVCAGCANFVVTDAHSSWWNERVAIDQDFLANPDVSGQARQVVGARLESSQKILHQLVHSGHNKNETTEAKK